MNVYRSLDQLPEFKHAVVTIGTFDGVHEGHQAIIRSIVAEAKKFGGDSVIITFHPHPRNVIRPEQQLYCLSTIHEKLELLEALGVDHVVVVPFSREFSEMEATAYVEDFLIRRFHPRVIVIGYDHRFGRDRKGDIHLLKEIAQRHGIQVDEIGAKEIQDIAISSTRIRQNLAQGHVDVAHTLLGYAYSFTGIVVRGDGMGRQLGYPTANLHIEDEQKLIPGNGIYAVQVRISGEKKRRPGMMSIGTRPTFEGQDRRIEVHLFDYQGDLYGSRLTVELLAHLRSEKKFDSPADLIKAMHQDEVNTRAFLDTM
jgi:riboflavin kinase/FMN adenylyltransferase